MKDSDYKVPPRKTLRHYRGSPLTGSPNSGYTATLRSAQMFGFASHFACPRNDLPHPNALPFRGGRFLLTGSATAHFTTTTLSGHHPNTSGVYISSALVCGRAKVPAVIALTKYEYS